MRDYAGERDPDRNANFSRSWGDDPLALPDLQHLGREVAPTVVKDAGRRAIGRWPNRASGTHGAVAAEAFRRADAIRRKMGLDWTDLIQEQQAA